MKRQITIYESAQNGKITVFDDVECSTLKELKALLDTKNIRYSDMDFIEGITNTKLMADDSRIPENIPYKGKTTNNVFINILKKESKIKSGVGYSELSRTDLLREAKPFAKEIEDAYGTNYTRVKSNDIATFLNKKNACNAEEGCKPGKPMDILENIKRAIMLIAEEVAHYYDDEELKDEVKELLYSSNTETSKKQTSKSFFGDDIASLVRSNN